MQFMEKTIEVDRNAGIFVTLNPAGKVGRVAVRRRLTCPCGHLTCIKKPQQALTLPTHLPFTRRAMVAAPSFLTTSSSCSGAHGGMLCVAKGQTNSAAPCQSPVNTISIHSETTLTTLFLSRRSIAMSVPDNELIAEVLLVSEGFRTAKDLARKMVGAAFVKPLWQAW